MSPIIYSTGRREAPICITTLPNELDEAERAEARHAAINASDEICLDRLHKAITYLSGLGMGEKLATNFVQQVTAGVTGVAIRFETRFLEEERVGGERAYRDFNLILPGTDREVDQAIDKYETSRQPRSSFF